MKSIMIIIIVWVGVIASAQTAYKTFKVSGNLEVIKISGSAFVHVSYSETQWGRIASNGLVILQNKQAFLFDTPMDEPTTVELVKFIKDTLKAQITGFVPNHWHADCIGGLAYLQSLGINSYANKLTIELAGKNGKTVPENGFNDSLVLNLNNEKILCFYPGVAHTFDNIVVWIPAERILFGGCMVKELKATTMGNFADGELKSWPGTIRKVMDKFPEAKIVIPGHGQIGDFELLKHTLSLALENANK